MRDNFVFVVERFSAAFLRFDNGFTTVLKRPTTNAIVSESD